MPDRDLLTFRFSGGITDRGEMNFYEAGRYRYAAARLLYTLEEFRQTGTVKQKIRKIVNVDIITTTPQRGSFIDPVLISLAPILADNYLRIPLEKLLGWAFDRILPKSNQNDRVTKLAQTLAENHGEFARAAIEREKTQQAEIQSRDKMFSELVNQLRLQQDDPVALKAAAGVFRKLASSPLRVEDDIGSMEFAADEIDAELERQSLLAGVEAELERIRPDEEEEILRRVRDILPEVAQPLRRSATKLELTGANENNRIAVFNAKRIEQIKRKETGPESLFVGNITRYDKSQGYGRLHILGQKVPTTFRVPTELKSSSRDEILEAMKKPTASGTFTPIMDGTGKIILLIFKNLA